jgi:heme exporter protein C
LKLSFTAYSNPGNFLRIAAKLLPWLWGSTAFAFALGLFGTFAAPPDYQQGETVRIMYIHVPAAWTAMLAYTFMAVSALGSLVWRHPLADATQKAAAPLGATFTFICLVTGSLWGKPMWGTYWVWDARLTSVLVLFLIYLGLIALWQTIEDPSRAARAVSIMTLVGFINIPIVKFSVDWWNTLHQPASVFRMEGSAIARSMLWPLIVMALAYTLLFVTLCQSASKFDPVKIACRITIGRADLLTDPRFSSPAQIMANMTPLTAIFDELFGAQPMAHWHSVFAGLNVTFGEVRGPQEVINDPQLQENEIIVPLNGAGGKLTSTISSPIKVHGITKVPARRGPGLGEHTEEILGELGFDAKSIESFRESGAVPKAKERTA